MTEIVTRLLGSTKTDLQYQVDAICEGRPYCTWPNQRRKDLSFSIAEDYKKKIYSWSEERCN